MGRIGQKSIRVAGATLLIALLCAFYYAPPTTAVTLPTGTFNPLETELVVGDCTDGNELTLYDGAGQFHGQSSVCSSGAFNFGLGPDWGYSAYADGGTGPDGSVIVVECTPVVEYDCVWPSGDPGNTAYTLTEAQALSGFVADSGQQTWHEPQCADSTNEYGPSTGTYPDCTPASPPPPTTGGDGMTAAQFRTILNEYATKGAALTLAIGLSVWILSMFRWREL